MKHVQTKLAVAIAVLATTLAQSAGAWVWNSNATEPELLTDSPDVSPGKFLRLEDNHVVYYTGVYGQTVDLGLAPSVGSQTDCGGWPCSTGAECVWTRDWWTEGPDGWRADDFAHGRCAAIRAKTVVTGSDSALHYQFRPAVRITNPQLAVPGADGVSGTWTYYVTVEWYEGDNPQDTVELARGTSETACISKQDLGNAYAECVWGGSDVRVVPFPVLVTRYVLTACVESSFSQKFCAPELAG